MSTYISKSTNDLGIIAEELIHLLKTIRIVAFYGEMGSGKTTFIKALCHKIGVIDNVNSPSFAIINEYLTANKQPIYHFDLYRLKSEEELYDLGSEDYFYSGNICFIEWPEKAIDLIPEERINVFINELPNGNRSFRLEKH